MIFGQQWTAYVSMKQNYVKILALDFNLLLLYLTVDKLANIFINDCQINNNNTTNGIYEILVSCFV